MKIVTDDKLTTALHLAIGKQADYICESCKLYHFYFHKTSFSYSKDSIIKLLAKDLL